LALLTAYGQPPQQRPQQHQPRPKLTAENIDDVVRAMTLEEKAQLLVGGRNEMFGGENSTIGATQALVPGAAGTTAAVEALGIPQTVLSDGPAGLRIQPTRPDDSNTYYATGFPVGTALASSWNTDLVTQVGKAMGEEVLEYGVDILLAPGMNIHRNPLCGRNFEYFSEDPVVTGRIAAAYVNGVQSRGVGATVKHFAANNQETNRTNNNSIVSHRALREIYLKGFEIAVREAKPWAVMSSYNKLNGVYTMEDYGLLTSVLREDWGYEGFVMTDWIGLRNTAAEIRAGNDLMEPGMPAQSDDIVARVRNGELSQSAVDRCVRRILEYIVKTPRFNGYKYSNKPDLKAHAAITRQSATEGMVLLKNENKALPLASDLKNIALFGITSYDFIAGGTGSGDVNKAYVVDLVEGLQNAGLNIGDELKGMYVSYKTWQEAKAAGERTNTWFWGKPTLPEMSVSKVVIEKQAQSAEIAIITLGRQAGEGSDRRIDNDFNLTDVERQLLNDVCDAFHAAGKQVVVILNVGGVIETASWKSLPDAILCAWQSGQEGGNSVADVITGKTYPSGKLTMTFPLSCMDHPSSLNFPVNYQGQGGFTGFGQARREQKDVDYTRYEEGIYVGYRYFTSRDKEVSYPFGYGLSYTAFEYSGAKVKPSGGGFEAEITVKNTGSHEGKEIVELYVEAPAGGLEKPVRELKAFAKTNALKPGESQTLRMKVSDDDLASFDEAQSAWVSAAGKYTVVFAASVADIRARADYSLTKERIVKTNDLTKPQVAAAAALEQMTGLKNEVYLYRDTAQGIDDRGSMNAPMFMVFVDSRCNAPAALELAETTGLKYLADRYSGSVAVVNPVGPTWDEKADLEAYKELINRLRVISNLKVIGIGKGAAFVHNAVSRNAGEVAGIFTWGGSMTAKGAGDIPVPAYISGADRAAADFYIKANDAREKARDAKHIFYANDAEPLQQVVLSLDRAQDLKSALADAWKTLLSKNYRFSNYKHTTYMGAEFGQYGNYELEPYLMFDELGVTRRTVRKELNQMRMPGGGAYFWYEYFPEATVDAPGQSVPLVVLLHGNGNDNRTQSETGGFIEVAAREGFIVAEIEWQGVGRFRSDVFLGADGIEMVVEDMKRSYPQIDPTRIYVQGLSAGAMMSAALGIKKSHLFAAVGGHSGGIFDFPLFGYNFQSLRNEAKHKSGSIETAYFLISGTDDDVIRFPTADNNSGNSFYNAIHLYQSLNGIPESAVDFTADPVLGLKLQDRKTVVTNKHITLETGWFYKGDVPLIEFTAIMNYGHWNFRPAAQMMWDFFKRFSRHPENGKLIYQ
jgi:beta-glucosidase